MGKSKAKVQVLKRKSKVHFIKWTLLLLLLLSILYT